MESKSLIRIVKAVSTHVGRDASRKRLSFIAVTSDRRIEAIDGKRAIRVDTDPPHGLPVGLYTPKRLLTLLKEGLAPIADAPLTDWPELDNVIPARVDGPAVALHLNPLYLAQSAQALADVAGGKDACVRIQPGADAWDVVRLDASGVIAKAVSVIAPMRA